MQESDENALRRLLAQARNEDPKRFAELFFDCVIARCPENSIGVMRRYDADQKLDAICCVVQGGILAAEVEKVLTMFKTRFDQATVIPPIKPRIVHPPTNDNMFPRRND
jgi:hypothetical protein